MCGIVAVLDPNLSPEALKALTVELTQKLAHRGPDEVGFHAVPGGGLGHARLSIMDPAGGTQPLEDKASGNVVAVNGEIYNHGEHRASIAASESDDYAFATTSDSEVVLPLFAKHGNEAAGMLDGMFGFCLLSGDGKTCLAARDPCGIKPLYRGWSADGRVILSSELKCLVGHVEEAEEFPAGNYWTPQTGYVRYFSPGWLQTVLQPEKPVVSGTGGTANIRQLLKDAVEKRLMSDVGYGFLLSGGLDSAVVCQLMSELTDMTQIKSFTVGMDNSPDLMAAREVSKKFNTQHFERIFTTEEAFAILPKVIYHLETYEPELIRSSIPNFFLAELAAQHVKVVLTGEGADELFAGYLYFRDCPDPEGMQRETLRIWDHLHNVNLQRSDRMSMAHGLEARVPFLDVTMLEENYGVVDPALKLLGGEEDKMEKHALRSLFTEEEIPREVLWRTKAMQCEGVGTNWVPLLQAMCEEKVTDDEMAAAAETYPINPPQSKEELYYRRLFDADFAGMDRFVHVWEGGCRAGGAAWQSAAYTRAGLVNTDQLKHGLMEGTGITTEAGTGKKMVAEPEAFC